MDLLVCTRDLVVNQQPVREYLQNRFSHLFIDEFQDTDPLQAEILLLLAADDATESDWLKVRPVAGKLFVVGDPKQSIYRFRLAEPGLFIERQQSARDPQNAGRETAIDLNANFRSGGGVLRLVNAMFSRLMAADLGGIAYDDRAALRPGTILRAATVLPRGESTTTRSATSTRCAFANPSAARVGLPSASYQ